MDDHAPNYAVFRLAKIRNLGVLRGASKHNNRHDQAEESLTHTAAPPMGQGVVLLDGQPDALAAWHERTNAVGLGTPRRDAVLAVEMVMSASPAWFANANQAERAEWTERSLAYARTVFGPENILQATQHEDETTPHIHVLGVPLEQKERARAGRPRKGREGAKRAPVLSWGLNADAICGGPAGLRDHQTEYAEAVADLGIRRGVPKKITGARHKPVSVYRDEIAEAQNTIEQDRAKAAHDRAEASKDRAGAKRGLTRNEKRATEAAEAFTLGLDAVEQRELVYNPKDPSKPALAPVENPVLPPWPSNAFGGWVSAAQPFLRALSGYAKRLAGLRLRETELEAKERTVAASAAAIARAAERQARIEERMGVIDGAARQDADMIARAAIIEFQDPVAPKGAEKQGHGRGRERTRG